MVMRLLGPTAPAVSGGVRVFPSSAIPRKFVFVAGEGIPPPPAGTNCPGGGGKASRVIESSGISVGRGGMRRGMSSSAASQGVENENNPRKGISRASFFMAFGVAASTVRFAVRETS